MTYFFEESVRRVPDVDVPRRFDETISSSAQRLRRRPDKVHRAAVAKGE